MPKQLTPPPLFISSHLLVWNLSGCAGASQKASTRPPWSPSLLTSSLSSSQIKQRGIFGICGCNVLTLEAGKEKKKKREREGQRGGGRLGGEHSIWGFDVKSAFEREQEQKEKTHTEKWCKCFFGTLLSFLNSTSQSHTAPVRFL